MKRKFHSQTFVLPCDCIPVAFRVARLFNISAGRSLTKGGGCHDET